MQEQSDDDKEKPLAKRALTTQKRRKEIVEAAAACFITQGFHQTSIRDIAKRAGISLGNLYNHFSSKTDLIAEIAVLESDDQTVVNDILSEDGKVQDILARFIAVHFDELSKPENAVLAAEITSEAMRNPQIAEPFLENRAQLVARLASVLISPDLNYPEDTTEMAELILTLVQSTAARAAFQPGRKQKATLGALQSSVCRLVGLSD
ncbi:TetR/AcrR family transcriptional regulator [Pseudaestuariivita rosea]|uniref:TetR/AcrR family transcriptional regulator n=1 Tax=Pseudaestuariivita rosea TaxID=2763263 RepID=UPI001ABBCCDF|nr:TetR/AcrR family transcriptional regulator [Pseudaestuariivita rosea]